MSLGFGPLKTSSKFYVQPSVKPLPPRPVTVPVSVTGSGSVQMTPRGDFKTFYDPSRVIDMDRLKVVADLRTQGSERGEVQEGDDGILGPGSNNGAFVSSPRTPVVTTSEKKAGLTPAQLVLIATASYFIFGG